MNAGPGLCRCPRCGETKPLTAEHFYFRADGRVNGYCRPCHKAYLRGRARNWDPYARHRRRLYQRAYYRTHYAKAARA